MRFNSLYYHNLFRLAMIFDLPRDELILNYFLNLIKSCAGHPLLRPMDGVYIPDLPEPGPFCRSRYAQICINDPQNGPFRAFLLFLRGSLSCLPVAPLGCVMYNSNQGYDGRIRFFHGKAGSRPGRVF